MGTVLSSFSVIDMAGFENIHQFKTFIQVKNILSHSMHMKNVRKAYKAKQRRWNGHFGGLASNELDLGFREPRSVLLTPKEKETIVIIHFDRSWLIEGVVMLPLHYILYIYIYRA